MKVWSVRQQANMLSTEPLQYDLSEVISISNKLNFTHTNLFLQ